MVKKVKSLKATTEVTGFTLKITVLRMKKKKKQKKGKFIIDLI